MKKIIYSILFSLSLLLFSCGQADKAAVPSSCDFSRYLKDPNTPQLAKTIFNDQEWSLLNDSVMLFLDSLSNPFYFKVVTISKKKSDGYYSEGLGVAGKEYVEENTKEFTRYFTKQSCFTSEDLTTWVNIVMLEFSILADDKSGRQSLMDNYVKKLNSNCSDCSAEQKDILKKFLQQLQKSWTEYLKAIDAE